MDLLPPRELSKAVKMLCAADPILGRVIQAVGPCRLKPDPRPFRMLARSIVSQQISMRAARSIQARLETLLLPRRLSPGAVASKSIEELQTAGLSRQKAMYLRMLAEEVVSGKLKATKLVLASDEDVIARLTQLHGIGVWTAQMFLMFCLGRLDVFPWQDLGIRTAMDRLYGLGKPQDEAAAEKVAAKWRPYSTIASWYLWRSLELKPA